MLNITLIHFIIKSRIYTEEFEVHLLFVQNAQLYKKVLTYTQLVIIICL